MARILVSLNDSTRLHSDDCTNTYTMAMLVQYLLNKLKFQIHNGHAVQAKKTEVKFQVKLYFNLSTTNQSTKIG